MPNEQLIAELRADISQFRREMNQATNVARDTSRNVERSNNRMSASFGGVARAVASFGAAIAGLGLIAAGRSIVDTGVKLQGLQSAFKAITGTAEGARKELDFVRRQSERLGLEFISTAKAFQNVAAAARGTALEGRDTREAFLGVVEAATVLGLSSDQVSGTLLALSQIITKGTVQAEELTGQLGERLPGAFRIAARAIGVTTEELSKMVQRGEVTSDFFVRRFGPQLRKEFGQAAEEAANNASRAFNRFQNAVTALKEEIVEAGFLDAVAAVANEFTKIIRTLSGSTLVRTKEEIAALNTRIEELKKNLEGLNQPLPGFLENLLGRGEQRARVREEIRQLEDALRAFKGEADDIGEAFGFQTEERIRAERAAQEAAEKARRDAKEAAEQARKDAKEAAEEAAQAAIEQAQLVKRLQNEITKEQRQVQRDAEEDLFRLKVDLRERAARIERDQIEEIAQLERDVARRRERDVEQQKRETEREFDRLTSNIQSRLANLFEDTLRGNITSAAEFMRDTFISAIAEIAAEAATQQIIVPLITGSGGQLGGQSGSGGILNTVVGFLGGGTTNRPVGGNRFNSPRGSELSGTGINNLGANFGQALGGIGAGVGAGITLGAIIPGGDTTEGQLGALAGAGSGAIAGAILGTYVFPGVGTVLGALIGGILGGAGGGALGGLFSQTPPKSSLAFRTSARNTGFTGDLGLLGPFGFVGPAAGETFNTPLALDQQATEFILQIDTAAAEVLNRAEQRLAAEALQAQGVTVTQRFREFSDEAVGFAFDRLSTILRGIGVNPAEVLTGGSVIALQSQFARFFERRRFNEDIRLGILEFTDPQAFALAQLEREQEERLIIAERLGADLVEVERLNALERERVLEESLTRSTGALRQFLVDITSGNAAASLLPFSQRLTAAQREFELQRNNALSGSLNEPALVSASQNLLNLSRTQFASGPEFFQVLAFVQRTIENVIERTTGSSSGVGSVASNTSATNDLIDQLLLQTEAQTQEIMSLRERLDRLVA